MANELANENRKLRRLHTNVLGVVMELMSVDLLKSQNQWNDKMAHLKNIVEQETRKRP